MSTGWDSGDIYTFVLDLYLTYQWTMKSAYQQTVKNVTFFCRRGTVVYLACFRDSKDKLRVRIWEYCHSFEFNPAIIVLLPVIIWVGIEPERSWVGFLKAYAVKKRNQRNEVIIKSNQNIDRWKLYQMMRKQEKDDGLSYPALFCF